MSAAALSSDAVRCEPNMTPLLDLVLQLIMFFMLCAHFVTEQVNEAIKLPQAIAAKALDETVANYTILNIDPAGVTTTLTGRGEERWETPTAVQNAMAIQYELDKARTKPADWEKGRGRTLVILRASRDCYFKQVHDIIKACQRAGYTDIRLRALKVDPQDLR
jgi:biopolymer transport protein ExbD